MNPASLHSPTLLSLYPCSPSSWHSESTGEYVPSRSHPPFLAPAGGVSLETVSELTGWVQIDGCPLSDYTTGPLKAAWLDLCEHSHPPVLTSNGPFHLTCLNISSTQAECVCSFFCRCACWMFITAYVRCCIQPCDWLALSCTKLNIFGEKFCASAFLPLCPWEGNKMETSLFYALSPSSQNDVAKPDPSSASFSESWCEM